MKIFKLLFNWLLEVLGITLVAKHYTIEEKLRKLAVKAYGTNVMLHSKIAFFGTMHEDDVFLKLINDEFNIKLTSLYTHPKTTDTYANYNSLALAVLNEINKHN